MLSQQAQKYVQTGVLMVNASSGFFMAGIAGEYKAADNHKPTQSSKPDQAILRKS